MSPGEYQDLIEFLGHRFEAIDQRFDTIDQQFGAMARRFDGVDRRFDEMQAQVDGNHREAFVAVTQALRRLER